MTCIDPESNLGEPGVLLYVLVRNVPVNSKTAHPPPPGQTPGHLTFLKNFGPIPHYVASLDGQMPHPLELQRGSNPPPFRHVKATVQKNFPRVKPCIFCNKQLATVWIKICVNCNFNDSTVINQIIMNLNQLTILYTG